MCHGVENLLSLKEGNRNPFTESVFKVDSDSRMVLSNVCYNVLDELLTALVWGFSFTCIFLVFSARFSSSSLNTIRVLHKFDPSRCGAFADL